MALFTDQTAREEKLGNGWLEKNGWRLARRRRESEKGMKRGMKFCWKVKEPKSNLWK